MPDYIVTLAEEAQRNVDAIHNWIADRSVDGARRWYKAFIAALGRIARDPERFAIAPEFEQSAEVIRSTTFHTRSVGHIGSCSRLTPALSA